MEAKYKILILIVIITCLIIVYNIYDNHNLDINFTSFKSQEEKLSTDYNITDESKEGFMAVDKVYFYDNIMFSTSYGQYIVSYYQNYERAFNYSIIDNELILVEVTDEDNNILCSKTCSGFLKVQEFLARGRVINELEKYY